MIKDYQIYDNFLDDPDIVVNSLRSQTYFTSPRDHVVKTVKNNIPLHQSDKTINHPGDPRNGAPYWLGYRSLDISYADNIIYNTIFSKLFDKIFESFVLKKINFEASAFFHLFTEEFIPQRSWLHKDQYVLLAGVLYLAKDALPNTGTVINANIPEKKISIENKFNRLVLYNANLVHGVEGCFGNSIENCRSAVVLTIKNLSILNDD